MIQDLRIYLHHTIQRSNIMNKAITVLVMMILAVTLIQAEQVILKNGKTLNGTVITADESTVTLDAGFGTTMTIRRDQIDTIQYNRGTENISNSSRSWGNSSETRFNNVNGSERSSADFQTISLMSRMATGAGLMGSGIGITTLGLVVGVGALVSIPFLYYFVMIPGIISLIILGAGIPMWAGGASMKNSARRQLEMMQMMSLDTGNNVDPAVKSSLMRIPIS
jgi:hypothetical protein